MIHVYFGVYDKDGRTEQRILHYISTSQGFGLSLDMRTPFNRLWFKYFEKTPWFNAESFKQLIDSMKKSDGSKLYFIITAQFPLVHAELTRAGFKDGRDFLNGLMFLSEAHGVPMNSYPLIKAL